MARVGLLEYERISLFQKLSNRQLKSTSKPTKARTMYKAEDLAVTWLHEHEEKVRFMSKAQI